MPFPAKIAPDAILEAAAALIRQDGLDAVSMRTLAARLNVRASSLYRHFQDRQALEIALAELTAARLLDTLQAAVTPAHKPTEALAAAADAYRTFAAAEAPFYAILHRAPGTAPNEHRRGLWKFLLGLVGAVTHDPDDTAAAVALWSFLHGFVSLQAAGSFGESGPHNGFHRGIHALIAGFKHQRKNR